MIQEMVIKFDHVGLGRNCVANNAGCSKSQYIVICCIPNCPVAGHHAMPVLNISSWMWQRVSTGPPRVNKLC